MGAKRMVQLECPASRFPALKGAKGGVMTDRVIAHITVLLGQTPRSKSM